MYVPLYADTRFRSNFLPTQVLGPNLYTTNEAPLYRRGLLSK
jgi:hypothetical protein